MINVIMSGEPLDLTPVLNQLKADLIADNAANLAAANSNTDTKTAALGVTLDSITTVNGNISTEVQAINGNTDAKIAEVKADIAAKGVIKSIQRGKTQVGGNTLWRDVVISPVDMSKAFVNLCNANSLSTSYPIKINLKDSSTLYVMATYSGYEDVLWEVIEYV